MSSDEFLSILVFVRSAPDKLVPENFAEWYFICATYNPSINEASSIYDVTDPDYWRNNMVDNASPSPTDYTNNSGFGNRSKVEIISRNDLLRARGYKT